MAQLPFPPIDPPLTEPEPLTDWLELQSTVIPSTAAQTWQRTWVVLAEGTLNCYFDSDVNGSFLVYL